MRTHADYHYGPCDVSALCANHRTTDGLATARMTNRGAALQHLAAKTNHVLGRVPRVWFWHCNPITSLTTIDAVGTGSGYMYYHRYRDGVVNARNYDCRVLTCPRTTGTGDCYALHHGGTETTSKHNEVTTAINPCQDIILDEFTVARGAPTGDNTDWGVDVYNYYPFIDVCCQDQTISTLDSTVHDCCDPSLADPGRYVLADLAEQIRYGFHRARTENLPMLFMWHAGHPGNHSATTDKFGIVIASSTYVNVIDQGFASRTATSPGMSCGAYYAGRGRTAVEQYGISVPCTARVLTSGTGVGTGKIKIEGPDHIASNYTEIDTDAVYGWHGSDSNVFYLNTTVDDTETLSSRNKCDIFGQFSAGETMYIYAIVAWMLYG